MKSNIFLLTCLLILSLNGYAQCSVTVPGASTIMTTINSWSDCSFSKIWMCSNANFSCNGGGEGCEIYAEQLDTVHLWTTTKNIDIFIKGPSYLWLKGDSNRIVHEDDVVILDEGQGNVFISCSSLVFDYTNVNIPTNCVNYLGDDELEPSRSIQIFPNPTNGNFQTDLNNRVSGEIKIFNSQGKVIYSQLFKNESTLLVEMPAYISDGIYMIKLSTSDAELTRRIVLQH